LVRSPIFIEKFSMPTLDYIGFTQVADTLFVSFFPDSVIYMIDKHEDRAFSKFGRQGRNMNTDYEMIHSIEEYQERERTDTDTYGYYTCLKYDEKRQWMFRGYTQGAHSQFDGLQIYKNHALIGDVDVPKGFSIVGYLNNQLIGAVEDKEVRELELKFYHVNFEMENASENILSENTEVLDRNGFLVGANTLQAGVVQANDSVVCEFRFVNRGSEPVKIVDYTVSCDCSELIYNDKEIPVNDTVVIKMIIDTAGKSVGNHSSVAVLKTNGKRRFYDITAHYTIANK